MSLRPCSDTSEAVPLEESLGLYLKQANKLKINVQLPKLRDPNQAISSWNVMEKIRSIVKPAEFLYLRTLKITSNIIKLEGEIETKSVCERALSRLKSAGSLNLSGFADKLQIFAARATASGPTRHDWLSFFRDARSHDEMKPGERPDTVHLQELPVRWFSDSRRCNKPSEKILRKAFGSFGNIRHIEIPYKKTVNNSSFGKMDTLQNELLFEVFIQYYEVVEFSIAMDALRGRKLLYKDVSGKAYTAEIKVDFDRSRYLSERNIKIRKYVLKRIELAGKSGDSKSDDEKNEFEEKSNDVPVSLVNDEEAGESEKKKIGKKEAKLLLKELLRRAEITERKKVSMKVKSRHKQESTKSQNSKKSTKRQKIRDPDPEAERKKTADQEQKELEDEERRKQKLLDAEQFLRDRLLKKMKESEKDIVKKRIEIEFISSENDKAQKSLKSIVGTNKGDTVPGEFRPIGYMRAYSRPRDVSSSRNSYRSGGFNNQRGFYRARGFHNSRFLNQPRDTKRLKSVLVTPKSIDLLRKNLS